MRPPQCEATAPPRWRTPTRGRPSSRLAQVSDENRQLRTRRAAQLEPALGPPAALEALCRPPQRRAPRLPREDGEEAQRLLTRPQQALEQRQSGGGVPPLHG